MVVLRGGVVFGRYRLHLRRDYTTDSLRDRQPLTFTLSLEPTTPAFSATYTRHITRPPTVGKEAISVAFVRPPVRPSVCPCVA